MTRVTCPVCGKRVPIAASTGVLRKHSTYATTCPQSGSEPIDINEREREYVVEQMEAHRAASHPSPFDATASDASRPLIPNANDAAAS